jgi:hypothetical protein
MDLTGFKPGFNVTTGGAGLRRNHDPLVAGRRRACRKYDKFVKKLFLRLPARHPAAGRSSGCGGMDVTLFTVFAPFVMACTDDGRCCCYGWELVQPETF